MACQIRINGKITFVGVGEVKELKKEHHCFRAVGGETPDVELDFTKASEAELKASNWTFKEAQKAVMQAYNVELQREEGDKKSDIIGKILDAKFRSIDPTILEKPNMEHNE